MSSSFRRPSRSRGHEAGRGRAIASDSRNCPVNPVPGEVEFGTEVAWAGSRKRGRCKGRAQPPRPGTLPMAQAPVTSLLDPGGGKFPALTNGEATIGGDGPRNFLPEPVFDCITDQVEAGPVLQAPLKARRTARRPARTFRQPASSVSKIMLMKAIVVCQAESADASGEDEEGAHQIGVLPPSSPGPPEDDGRWLRCPPTLRIRSARRPDGKSGRSDAPGVRHGSR